MSTSYLLACRYTGNIHLNRHYSGIRPQIEQDCKRPKKRGRMSAPVLRWKTQEQIQPECIPAKWVMTHKYEASTWSDTHRYNAITQISCQPRQIFGHSGNAVQQNSSVWAAVQMLRETVREELLTWLESLTEETQKCHTLYVPSVSVDNSNTLVARHREVRKPSR